MPDAMYLPMFITEDHNAMYEVVIHIGIVSNAAAVLGPFTTRDTAERAAIAWMASCKEAPSGILIREVKP